MVGGAGEHRVKHGPVGIRHFRRDSVAQRISEEACDPAPRRKAVMSECDYKVMCEGGGFEAVPRVT